jgi:DNA-binding NarL/FixJ family response regulator
MIRAEDYLRSLNEHMEAYVNSTETANVLPLLDGALDLLQALRDRELLDAVAYGDRQADIAEVLGVSHQAVSQQIRNARARELKRRDLRRQLRQQRDQDWS